MKLKNSYIMVLVCLLILVLSSCTKIENDVELADIVETPINQETPETETIIESETAYPITIQHAFGETVINSQPERVATIAWGNQDLVLALGVTPVGISKANYGVLDDSGLLPWTAQQFETLGVETPVLFDDVAGLNYEAIADVEPDVILAAYSGITQEEYDLLSAIAPVIAYPNMPWETLWRDQILINAMGMGMQAEGEALLAEIEAFIDSKVAEHPALEGLSAAFFYFMPHDLGTFYVYLPSDPRAAFLTDLGMLVPDSVAGLAEGADSFAIVLSAENADVLYDVDLMIAYGDDSVLEALQADPLLGTIPAIAKGAVALIPDGTPLAAAGTPSALSIPATLEAYLELLASAANSIQ